MLRFVAPSLLLLSTGGALASILVVRSDGPSAKSYPIGKRLPDNARILLRANDRLTVLDRHGTRELRGPGTFTAASAHGALAQLTSAEAETGRRIRIAGLRRTHRPHHKRK